VGDRLSRRRVSLLLVPTLPGIVQLRVATMTWLSL
jgi:hypothetical protein